MFEAKLPKHLLVNSEHLLDDSGRIILNENEFDTIDKLAELLDIRKKEIMVFKNSMLADYDCNIENGDLIVFSYIIMGG